MFFVELVQIKTGNRVKVPVRVEEVEMLRSLPIRGQRPEPFILNTNNRTIKYGRKFWFWTGHTNKTTGGVGSNIQQWLDDVSRVLELCQTKHGKFENHQTPHCFRHYFAVTMLNTVDVKTVSEWLGHRDVKTTERHYLNANRDRYVSSHAKLLTALKTHESQERHSSRVLRMKKIG
jgi:integrase